MASPNPRRGESWVVDWSPGRGSEQTGRRPALIVQTDPANRNPRYPNTIAAAISRKGREVPFHVAVEPTLDNGLAHPSFVKCEQLMTVSKSRLEERLGALDVQAREDVSASLRTTLDV